MNQKPNCSKCKSNREVVKYGFRKTEIGKKQTYFCKYCNYKFTPEDGFRRMRFAPEIITAALDLYYKGLSLRKIEDHLYQFHGVKVSNVAILKWIRKYAKLLKQGTEKLKPEIIGNIHADESFIRRKENWRENGNGSEGFDARFFYFWDAIDDVTRFIWAFLSKARDLDSAKKLFKGIKYYGGYPPALIHDRLWEYDSAFNKYFYRKSENVKIERWMDKSLNNPIERFQGTIKERTKVMRGLTVFESSEEVLEGFVVYYNFIRRHVALKGRTPAEEAGIELELGRNRWLSLISFYFSFRFFSLMRIGIS
ncbi:MAG: transposase [Candidatus Hydrothermarchaeota archaeon]